MRWLKQIISKLFKQKRYLDISKIKQLEKRGIRVIP